MLKKIKNKINLSFLYEIGKKSKIFQFIEKLTIITFLYQVSFIYVMYNIYNFAELSIIQKYSYFISLVIILIVILSFHYNLMKEIKEDKILRKVQLEYFKKIFIFNFIDIFSVLKGKEQIFREIIENLNIVEVILDEEELKEKEISKNTISQIIKKIEENLNEYDMVTLNKLKNSKKISLELQDKIDKTIMIKKVEEF
jgi:hypothetical protein